MNYGISVLFRAIPLVMALFCFFYGGYIYLWGDDSSRMIAGPVVFSHIDQQISEVPADFGMVGGEGVWGLCVLPFANIQCLFEELFRVVVFLLVAADDTQVLENGGDWVVVDRFFRLQSSEYVQCLAESLPCLFVFAEHIVQPAHFHLCRGQVGTMSQWHAGGGIRSQL